MPTFQISCSEHAPVVQVSIKGCVIAFIYFAVICGKPPALGKLSACKIRSQLFEGDRSLHQIKYCIRERLTFETLHSSYIDSVGTIQVAIQGRCLMH